MSAPRDAIGDCADTRRAYLGWMRMQFAGMPTHPGELSVHLMRMSADLAGMSADLVGMSADLAGITAHRGRMSASVGGICMYPAPM